MTWSAAGDPRCHPLPRRLGVASMDLMESNRGTTRRGRRSRPMFRVVLAVGALVSGCYYRGCACDHRHGGYGGHERSRHDFDQRDRR